MSESSFGGDNDMTAGATVESSDNVDSATADREAAFDESVSSADGTVTNEDAVVANPPEDSAVDDAALGPNQRTSYDADVDAGYDDTNRSTS